MTATFVPRSAWGARPRRKYAYISDPGSGGVTIHHTGGTPFASWYHSKCAGQVRGIQNHHMDGNGWDDIAYSYLVCTHGYVYEGRGVGIRTAANGTNVANARWYAVCALLGGSGANYDTRTAEMVAGVRLAVARLRSNGSAGPGINGHRDHLSTACPGALYDLVRGGTFEPGAEYPGDPDTPPAEPGVPPFEGVLLHYPPVTVHPSARTWQARMRERGWSLGVDGAYGEESRRVCLAFQAEKGLTVDGVVGPRTWYAAWQTPATPPASHPAAAPDWPGVLFTYPPVTVHSGVRTWQARMRERGWSLGVDGAYGEESRRVCLAFQAEKGLTEDGVVGPTTWHAAWSSPVT
ncbi:N-acetylmuramoyl-L-alanine amidase [Streptomyces sp. JJ66]|uniref:peptidoglycan recognition protein family protein n=1 Tax=Streptomyces sp. JJ66 TaxID=2803843 RepID=UPI0027E232E8|nr:N-acetylmuramoyl-L-alanine amidase [Streptomyces sp. JJ66]